MQTANRQAKTISEDTHDTLNSAAEPEPEPHVKELP